jgi:hypothetical protein
VNPDPPSQSDLQDEKIRELQQRMDKLGAPGRVMGRNIEAEIDAEKKAHNYLVREIGDMDKRMPTEEEMDALRRLAEKADALLKMEEQDARTKWLWATARTWLLFIAAAVTGLTLGYEALRSAVKKLSA